MNEYHKIVTMFKRDPSNLKRVLHGEFAEPVVEMLATIMWTWTEKVDGTNIRVMLEGDTVRFGGKTDNAQIPARLVERLQERFTVDSLRAVFPSGDFCLYGEGYGYKIQKVGSKYIPDDVDFVLFDVRAGSGIWLERSSVEDIGAKMGCKVVPVVGRGTLWAAADMVGNGYLSRISHEALNAEGLIMRPEVELLDRAGRRIITKLKFRDYQS